MSFFSTIGSIVKKAAPIAGIAASAIPGGGIVSSLAKKSGVLGAIGKGLGIIGKAAPTAAAVASGVEGYNQQKQGQAQQNQALGVLQGAYNEGAPLRQYRNQLLTGTQPQRQNLSSTFGTVSRGAAVPGQVSPAQGALAEQTNAAAGRVGSYALPSFQGVGATDTSGYGGYMKQAADSLGRLGVEDRAEIAPGSYAPSARSVQARSLGSTALDSLASAPDRQQIAANTLKLFDEQTAPELAAQRRAVGESAAAFGRTNAGMTTNQLTDLDTQHQTQRNQLIRQLTDDAASQTLADNQARLNAILGAEGQYTGEDISENGVQQGLRDEARNERQFGVNQEDRQNQLGINLANEYQGLGQSAFGNAQSLRNEARTERDAGQTAALNNLSANQGVLASLAGLEGQRFGQESQLRDESRGERAYNDTRSDTQTDRNIQQQQLQEDLLNGDTSRQNQLISLLSAAGGDPGALSSLLAALGTNREAAGGSLLDTAGQILGRTRGAAPAPSATPLGSLAPTGSPSITLGNGTRKIGRPLPTSYNRDLLPANLDLRRILPATTAAR